MKEMLKWLMDEESGQGMVEYGIIVALVVVIAIFVFSQDTGLGEAIGNMFDGITGKVEEVTSDLG